MILMSFYGLKPIVVLLLSSAIFSARADNSDAAVTPGNDAFLPALIEPAAGPATPATPSQIDWPALFRQSSYFLAVKHGFRWATEEGTRNASGAFFPGYAYSVASIHGWSDGDPFYVNYIGHPMMGSASGYIWLQNDRAYSRAAFGLNRHYWKSRLRATAFSFVYSAQFEIGPVSEANIGFIQSRWPAHGLVDHVITPSVGMAWMVAEDAIDRYLISGLERHVRNRWIRILARGFLNPSRSMANMMAGKAPFYRPGRGVLGDYSRGLPLVDVEPVVSGDLPEDTGPAPFELTVSPRRQTYLGAPGLCVGGGAEAAFRVSNHWQIVADVGGCPLGGLPEYNSGDSLTFLAGPRWAPSERRLRPYMQFLIGGTRLTQETVFEEKRLALVAAANGDGLKPPRRPEYSRKQITDAFALSAGTGLDLKLNRAAAIKLASIEYTRSWNKPLSGIDYNSGIRLQLGVTLRMGTW